MTQACPSRSPYPRAWRAILALSLLGNFFLALSFAGIGSEVKPDDATTVRPSHRSSRELPGSVREERRKREQETTEEEKIPVSFDIVRQLFLDLHVEDARVTEGMAEALSLTPDERRLVDVSLQDFIRRRDGFLVAGSTRTVDQDGIAWITTPDASVFYKDSLQQLATGSAKLLGTGRSQSFMLILGQQSPYQADPFQWRFSITRVDGEDIVKIEQIHQGKIVGRETETGVHNIRKRFGNVIDHFSR